MIVCFGSINVDLVFLLQHLPGAGETVLTPHLSMVPGGKGANQACAAARDGAHVVMVGAVGRDAMAAEALIFLRDAGVDLARVVTADAPTAVAAVFVAATGENAIGVGSGANLLARADQVEDTLLCPLTTLLLQMEVGTDETVTLIRRARTAGARIILNLAPAAPIPRDVFPLLDILVVNETEAAFLGADHEATAATLHKNLGCAVVRTLGGAGSEYAGASGMFHIPVHPVVVRNTTGAGDCFTGVLAASLDRGLSIAAALRRASTAAALCCARPGTQDSLPTGAEIDAALP
ncbi:MAG: ribokinase [Acetobacteraceae bacterium]|nr:ribokinase [Acetobacteraceae bacterium]